MRIAARLCPLSAAKAFLQLFGGARWGLRRCAKRLSEGRACRESATVLQQLRGRVQKQTHQAAALADLCGSTLHPLRPGNQAPRQACPAAPRREVWNSSAAARHTTPSAPTHATNTHGSPDAASQRSPAIGREALGQKLRHWYY